MSEGSTGVVSPAFLDSRGRVYRHYETQKIV